MTIKTSQASNNTEVITQLQNLKKHLHTEQIEVENELYNRVSAHPSENDHSNKDSYIHSFIHSRTIAPPWANSAIYTTTYSTSRRRRVIRTRDVSTTRKEPTEKAAT